jgi:hypothetical protein
VAQHCSRPGLSFVLPKHIGRLLLPLSNCPTHPPTPLAADAPWPPTWQLTEVFPPACPQKESQAAGRVGGRDKSQAAHEAPGRAGNERGGWVGLLLGRHTSHQGALAPAWPALGQKRRPPGVALQSPGATWNSPLAAVVALLLAQLLLPKHVGRHCCSSGGIPTRPPLLLPKHLGRQRGSSGRYSHPPAPKRSAKPQGGRVGETNLRRRTRHQGALATKGAGGWDFCWGDTLAAKVHWHRHGQLLGKSGGRQGSLCRAQVQPGIVPWPHLLPYCWRSSCCQSTLAVIVAAQEVFPPARPFCCQSTLAVIVALVKLPHPPAPKRTA